MRGKRITVLIVGADKIKPFIPHLKALGAEEVLHWDARNSRSSKNKVPERAEMVIFLTNFLNHNAAKTLKRQIKERNLPAIYCRRAWTEMAAEVKSTIERCKFADNGNCPQAEHCKRKKSLNRK